MICDPDASRESHSFLTMRTRHGGPFGKVGRQNKLVIVTALIDLCFSAIEKCMKLLGSSPGIDNSSLQTSNRSRRSARIHSLRGFADSL